MAALLEQRILSNGLRLEIRDESRKTAGNRWLLSLRALVVVPLPTDPSEEISKEILDLLRREIGDSVYFQQMASRNFISENEKSGLLENLKKNLLENSLPYLSHSDFARRFLKSIAGKIQEQGRFGLEYLDKVLSSLRAPQ